MHQFAPLHTVIIVCVKNNISADVAYHRFLSLNPWSPERTTLSQVFLVGFAVGILRADSPTVPPPPLPPLPPRYGPTAGGVAGLQGVFSRGRAAIQAYSLYNVGL